MHEAPITIALDGCARELRHGTTLAELIAGLAQSPDSIATAVDGVFVGRGERATHVLREGSCVLLFRPIAGG
jgi:sulfur carrier protein